MLTLLGVIGWGMLAIAHAHTSVPLRNVSPEIQVHVIDGRTGNPIAHEHILIFATNDPHNPKSQLIDRSTDAHGIVVVPADFRYIQVFVDWHVLCSKHPNQIEYVMSEITRKGVKSSNSCGRVKVNVQPGDLYIFARPRHWWESTGLNTSYPECRNRNILLVALAP